MVNVNHKPLLNDANYLIVEDVLDGLWRWASIHRSQLSKTTFVGITGSNGKTIVKEWLSQLLDFKYNIGKSPRSFNSRIGVPLSILEIKSEHQIALIEVGISQVDEMTKLAKILVLGLLNNHHRQQSIAS